MHTHTYEAYRIEKTAGGCIGTTEAGVAIGISLRSKGANTFLMPGEYEGASRQAFAEQHVVAI